MELEDQQGFNNTLNYHPTKPYKSSSTKKYHGGGERSSLFNLNVPLSEKNLNQFIHSFEKTKSFETQLDFINALLKASPDTLEKYADNEGLATLARILHESSRELPPRIELVDRILSYLNKINLTKDMITKSRIHQAIETIKSSPAVTEELSNKTFKLMIKWREVIKEWQDEDGERQAQEYEREKRARSFLKRPTNRYDRSGNRDNLSRSSDERSDTSPPSHDHKKYIKPRREGYIHQKNNNRRYDNGSRYPRDRNMRNSDSDDQDDEYTKKSVKWHEDENIVRFKFFRISDEPSHRGLTEEEVNQLQDKMLDETKGVPGMSHEDIKHKESQMEGRSLKMRRDTEKEIQNKLNAMVETLTWYRPKRMEVAENIIYGRDSLEGKEHEKRISTKLPCFYLKEYQIPDHPSFESVKNNKREIITEPAYIPLNDSVAERGPEENQDLIGVLENLVQKTTAEAALATTTTTEKNPTVEFGRPDTAQKKEEEKKASKPTQPVRGILKKSKEQIQKEKEEAARLEEEKRKEKEKKAAALDSGLVMKLMNGELTQEEQENLVQTLQETGDAQGLLQNIATLKKFMTNVSQTNKPKRKDKFQPNLGPQYGQDPKKIFKPNTEPQSNMLTNMPPQDLQSPLGQGQGPLQPLPDEYDDEPIDFRNSPHQGQMGMRGLQKMKKNPFKPNNYKTVPCVLFHSPRGCHFGDTCNFIHDQAHAGRQTPNMHKYVHPMVQLNKTGTRGPDDQEPMQDSPPPSNYNPPMNVNPNNFYGGSGRNEGMNKGPSPGHYMSSPMNRNMNNPPGSNYPPMNQQHQHSGPHNQYMRSGPRDNMGGNMSYNNNRMGRGGHHNPHMNYSHGHQGGHGNQPHHPGHPTHGGHPSHLNQHGGHPMMMPPDSNAYRHDMPYQQNNVRMPPNPQGMQMNMGYNPMMMPPKGVMPPAGGGYGMMDMNKGKDQTTM